MDIIQWNGNLSLHMTELDYQHKIWINLMNTLYHITEESNFDKSIAIDLLDTIDSYLLFHTSFEERLMKSINFPGIEEHKRLHKALLSSIPGFQKQLSLDQRLINVTILNELITDHIVHQDKKIEEFLQQGSFHF